MIHFRRQFILALVFACLVAPNPAAASHHRGGRISWTRTGPMSVNINLQVVFERLPNTPGGSGPGGLPRVNDIIQDPLSEFRAPVFTPVTGGSIPFTLVVISSTDYQTSYKFAGYNLFDSNFFRVIAVGTDEIVCESAFPVPFTFPATGRYAARLYMWARELLSTNGEEGLFNRPGTMGIVETVIDLTAPGALTTQNSAPAFSQLLPGVLEFSANQILNDANGSLTPGAQLLPPPSSPLHIADADVIAGNPQSDILTFQITNPNTPTEAVPGLTIDNQGHLSWDPAAIPSSKRKQTCGTWSVTIRASDWAYDHPPTMPGALSKSTTELEVRIRINEPTAGLPTLILSDVNDVPLPPQNDPIEATVPAGVLTFLAKYQISDPDQFPILNPEVVAGGSGFAFDPAGGCATPDPGTGIFGLQGTVRFCAALSDAGQTFPATIRGRDDDSHVTAPRSFLVHVGPAAAATLSVTLDRYVSNCVHFELLPPSLVVAPTPPNTNFYREVEFRITGKRDAIGGESCIPLILSSSWEHPIGTVQVATAPPGAIIGPALPLSGLPNPIATFQWTPEISDIGQHRLRFTVADGQGGTASAFVDVDVRPFTTMISLGNLDYYTGVIDFQAWNQFLRATLTALDPGYVISFPSLKPGSAVDVPLPGNIAEFKWRAMGVQVGRNLVSVHVVAGALTYDGNLTIDVTNPLEPSWWTADAGEQSRVINQFATQKDFAMANQGQVKHMARMAAIAIKLAKLNNSQLLITQAQVDALLEFTDPLNPIGTFTTTKNFIPCNQGQLKAIASKFYEAFANLATPENGVLFPTNGQATLPWSSSAADDANYAPVNIGQVKALFGFGPSYFYP